MNTAAPVLPDRPRFSQEGIEFDSNGMPIMPEELQPFAEKILPRGAKGKEMARTEAQLAYDHWKQNRKWRSDISVKVLDEADELIGDASKRFDLPCASLSPSDFDAEEPNPEAYVDLDGVNHLDTLQFDSRLVEIGTARAKKACSECPIRVQCLTSSLTNPVRNRQSTVDPYRVEMTSNLIFGGWGPAARKMIFDAFIDLWIEEEEDGPYLQRYQEEQELEYERDLVLAAGSAEDLDIRDFL